MGNNELFNSSENNPTETTPWDGIAEDAKTPLEERDGNTQLGVDESLGTEAPAEVDPFDPPLSAPDVPPATPDVPPATPATPEPSETQPTAEPYGGANGENTGDQVNQVE